MRVNECTILMLPGRGNSPPGHWQSRWEGRLSRARRVEQPDWERPDRDLWVAAVVAAIGHAPRPVVLVAHALGAIAALRAAHGLGPGHVAGLYLVAPPSDAGIHALDGTGRTFAPVPRGKLPCPAALVASRNDPMADYVWSEALAAAIGADFVDAGEAGSIDAESGFGPWPEGLMRFGSFMRTL